MEVMSKSSSPRPRPKETETRAEPTQREDASSDNIARLSHTSYSPATPRTLLKGITSFDTLSSLNFSQVINFQPYRLLTMFVYKRGESPPADAGPRPDWHACSSLVRGRNGPSQDPIY